MRERSYYTQQREEVFRLMNTRPGVLDEGCRVAGIEVVSGAAAEASMIQPEFVPNAGRIIALWQEHGPARRIHDLVLLLGGAPFDPTDKDLKEMLAIQFLVTAARRP